MTDEELMRRALALAEDFFWKLSVCRAHGTCVTPKNCQRISHE